MKSSNLFQLLLLGVASGLCLSLASVSVGQSASKTPEDVEVLFDGSSMDCFRGYKTEEIGKGWKVSDGALYFDGSGGGDIISKKMYENFELTFAWKVSEGANSGIMYRVTTGDGAPYLSGPEYQILDDAKHRDGRNNTTSAGSLYALYVPDGKMLKPVGEWNTGKIVINNDAVEHWVNGTKVVSATIGSDDWKERVNKSKFKTWKKFGVSKKGHICLQDHGDEVWFRDIKIKSL